MTRMTEFTFVVFCTCIGRILRTDRGQRVGDIATGVGYSRYRVRRALRTLAQAGLAREVREGSTVVWYGIQR